MLPLGTTLLPELLTLPSFPILLSLNVASALRPTACLLPACWAGSDLLSALLIGILRPGRQRFLLLLLLPPHRAHKRWGDGARCQLAYPWVYKLNHQGVNLLLLLPLLALLVLARLLLLLLLLLLRLLPHQPQAWATPQP